MATKGWGAGYRAAASKAVTRSGRHFAQFTVVDGQDLLFGVIPPGWDVEGGQNEEEVAGHCFYWKRYGFCIPSGLCWVGMQTATEQGDRIGMLLDLGQGNMTVWKNDVKWGV